VCSRSCFLAQHHWEVAQRSHYSMPKIVRCAALGCSSAARKDCSTSYDKLPEVERAMDMVSFMYDLDDPISQRLSGMPMLGIDVRLDDRTRLDDGNPIIATRAGEGLPRWGRL